MIAPSMAAEHGSREENAWEKKGRVSRGTLESCVDGEEGNVCRNERGAIRMGMFLRTGKRYAVREAERARSAVPGARAGGPTCAKSRFPTPQSGPGGF